MNWDLAPPSGEGRIVVFRLDPTTPGDNPECYNRFGRCYRHLRTYEERGKAPPITAKFRAVANDRFFLLFQNMGTSTISGDASGFLYRD